MDRTKKTVVISAVLVGSFALLTAGLYLKAINTETPATPQDTEQMEMMDMDMPMDMPQKKMKPMHEKMMDMPMHKEMKGKMSGMMGDSSMMGAEVVEEEIDLPDQPAAQQDAKLSEQDIEAILKEIMDSGELEMSEEEITVDETE